MRQRLAVIEIVYILVEYMHMCVFNNVLTLFSLNACTYVKCIIIMGYSFKQIIKIKVYDLTMHNFIMFCYHILIMNINYWCTCRRTSTSTVFDLQHDRTEGNINIIM